MTTEETIDLLTLMQAYDRRTVGRTDVAAWHLVVSDLPFADAQAAVLAHYRESRDWIMPADVRSRVNEMRRERLENAPVLDPPHEVADNPAAYQAWLEREQRKIADGTGPLRAVES